MPKITRKELRKILDYDNITGTFIWKISPKQGIYIGDVAGDTAVSGYRRIQIRGERYLEHRLAWLYEKGYMPENGIDHINRCKDDNRIENLREVSQMCNMRNRGKPKNNKSGVKGVCWCNTNNKWRAFIVVDRKFKNLGYSGDFIEAVKLRNEAEKKYKFYICCKDSSAYNFLKTHYATEKMIEIQDCQDSPMPGKGGAE